MEPSKKNNTELVEDLETTEDEAEQVKGGHGGKVGGGKHGVGGGKGKVGGGTHGTGGGKGKVGG
jgi:hypothetical protein